MRRVLCKLFERRRDERTHYFAFSYLNELIIFFMGLSSPARYFAMRGLFAKLHEITKKMTISCYLLIIRQDFFLIFCFDEKQVIVVCMIKLKNYGGRSR